MLVNFAKGQELEVRLYLDPRIKNDRARHDPPDYGSLAIADVLKSIYKTLPKQAILSQTIDIYTPAGRRQITFDPATGLKTKQAWIVKTPIKSQYYPSDVGGYKIAHAAEIVHAKEWAEVKDSSAARLRVRGSWPTILENWRLDITLIKHMANSRDLKQARTAFITPLKTWEDAPHKLCDWVEFEFEYVGSAKQVSVDSELLHVMYDQLLGWLPGSEYGPWVRWASKTLSNPQHHMIARPGNTRMLHKFSAMLPRAHEITRTEWSNLYRRHRGPLTIRQKINGDRQLLVIEEKKVTVFRGGALDEDVKCRLPPVGKGLYMFDTEYLDGKWYILHPLVIDSEYVLDVSDVERMKRVPVGGDLEVCPFKFAEHGKLSTVINHMWTKKTLPLDGLLITLNNTDSYWTQVVVKWKPSEETTIDFLVYKCPPDLQGAPYVKTQESDTLYLLLVGSNHAQLVPQRLSLPVVRGYRAVPFTPENSQPHVYSSARNDLHGKICEMLYANGKWILKKVRTDKVSALEGGSDMGNNFRTAITAFSRYSNKFDLEHLYLADMDTSTLVAPELVRDATHVLFYYPPRDLVPPSSVKHMLSVGPVEVGGITNLLESKVQPAEFPHAFIGGSPLVLSYGLPPTGVRKWIKNMQILVAPGGKLVHLGPGSLDPGSDFASDGPGTWRRVIAGNRARTSEQVCRENKHVSLNPDAAFVYTFSRRKTENIMSYYGAAKPSALLHYQSRGVMLCFVEFLASLGPGLIYRDPSVPALIETLFPDHKFTDKENSSVEYYISCVLPGDDMKMKPTESLIKFTPPKTSTFQMPKGTPFLIPYQSPEDESVMLRLAGSDWLARSKWSTVQSSVWSGEMRYFHHIYRPTGFQYIRPRNLDMFDCCYDCRCEITILTKYCKSTKKRPVDLTSAIDSMDSFDDPSPGSTK